VVAPYLPSVLSHPAAVAAVLLVQYQVGTAEAYLVKTVAGLLFRPFIQAV
jgi:hypothetical protein